MKMEVVTTFHRLLLPASLAILLFSEIAQTSEQCQFQQGGTSVLAYCEQGCCTDHCCSTESAEDTLHRDILIIVCVVAGMIIIALIIISVVCFFKDKKKKKGKTDLAETGSYPTPAAAGIGLQTYSNQPRPPRQSHQQETTFISHGADQSPHPTRPTSAGTPRRHSSVRPSDVSLHREDIENLSATPSSRLSGRRPSANNILVQERKSSHDDRTWGNHSQLQSESTSLPSDGKERASLDGARGLSRRESESGGKSDARPLSNQRVFIHRKSIVHDHERTQDGSGGASKSSLSHRRRGSDPLILEQLDSEAGVMPSQPSARPSTSYCRRGSSKVFSQDEFFQHHSGNRRYTQVRHSDGFLDTKNSPLSSILRPLSAHRKKVGSVHFQQEQSSPALDV